MLFERVRLIWRYVLPPNVSKETRSNGSEAVISIAVWPIFEYSFRPPVGGFLDCLFC
jgi:hypothetical protein